MGRRLLRTATVIAKAMNVPRAYVYGLRSAGAPIFKMKDADRSPVCAWSDELFAWLARRQADAIREAGKGRGNG